MPGPAPPLLFSVFVFPRPPAASEGPGLPLTERSKTLALEVLGFEETHNVRGQVVREEAEEAIDAHRLKLVERGHEHQLLDRLAQVGYLRWIACRVATLGPYQRGGVEGG